MKIAKGFSRCAVRHLKLLGAILILAGLVLPLYSCRGHFEDAAGRVVKFVDAQGVVIPEADIDIRQPLPPGVVPLDASEVLPAGVSYRKNYHYFFSDFSKDEPSDWIRLAGFLWPMAAAWSMDRLKRGWARWLLRGFEPVLLLVTSFSLCVGAMFGTKEIGFWSAWMGLILYGGAAAWTDVVALLDWNSWGRWPLATLLCLALFGSTVVAVLAFFDGFV
jgi:hypothetical protein